MQGISKWKLLALIASLWFVGDQVTKYLAVERLTAAFTAARAHTTGEKIAAFVSQKNLLERGLADPVPVTITPFWQNRYTQNRGAAWGVLAGAGEQFRVPFFYLVSLAAVIFIFSYYRKLRTDQRYLQISLALVLGGAIGNAVDRILRGYVIDFIDWHWFDPNWLRPQLHWPTFNVADSGISVGLAMLLLEMLFAKKSSAAKDAAPAPRKA
ncbi:MAG: signal peptidase II [Deltaproteobacteria bacterium]